MGTCNPASRSSSGQKCAELRYHFGWTSLSPNDLFQAYQASEVVVIFCNQTCQLKIEENRLPVAIHSDFSVLQMGISIARLGCPKRAILKPTPAPQSASSISLAFPSHFEGQDFDRSFFPLWPSWSKKRCQGIRAFPGFEKKTWGVLQGAAKASGYLQDHGHLESNPGGWAYTDKLPNLASILDGQ